MMFLYDKVIPLSKTLKFSNGLRNVPPGVGNFNVTHHTDQSNSMLEFG